MYAVPHWYPAQVYDTKERRVVWLVGVNNTNKEADRLCGATVCALWVKAP